MNLYEWAPIPIRLILGFGFAYHGFPKLFSAQQRGELVGMLEAIGVPLPSLMAWVVGLVESLGAVALFTGMFVSVAAVLLSVNMLVAMVAVHLPHGFNFINITGMTESGPQFGMPGYEVNLLYLAGLISLILSGAGKVSINLLASSD